MWKKAQRIDWSRSKDIKKCDKLLSLEKSLPTTKNQLQQSKPSPKTQIKFNVKKQNSSDNLSEMAASMF